MGVFLFNYFAEMCPQRGNGSLNVPQMVPLSIIYVIFGEIKGCCRLRNILHSDAYSCELSETG